MKRRRLELMRVACVAGPSVRPIVGLVAILMGLVGLVANDAQARGPGPSWSVGEVGACCVKDPPVCYQSVTEVACLVLGGEWLGPGSTCNDCEFTVTGGCCFNGGDCVDVTSSYCELAGGVWLGNGTTCAEDGSKCGEVDPNGACCLATSCIDVTETTCISVGGSWLGPDTDCASAGDKCITIPIYVPEDFATIQGAIDAAVDGAEISVAAGVYGGTGDVAVDLGGKQVWLHSRQGAALTFVTGDGARRVVLSSLAAGNSSLVEGFTFLGGVATERGGGLYVTNGGSPVFQDCVIRSSTATSGGGCAISFASPRFISCDFIANSASDYGGAIEVRGSGTPEFIDCFITENSAGLQAGRAAVNIHDGGNAFIADSSICGNLPEQILGDWVDGGGNSICQCPADVTGDGVVDGFDLTELLAWWGPCPDDCEFDFDSNGEVDGSDLLVVLSAWGPCPG